jgi:aspartate-semialdehyde dehydrogenase
MNPKKRIPVGILGATGAVGQRFIQLLDNHPLFEVVALTGSDRSVGQAYQAGCRWLLPTAMPEGVRAIKIVPTDPIAMDVPLVFSALPSDTARTVEPQYAQRGCMVCSNASAYRMEADVPLLLPEVNPDHIQLVGQQRAQRGWSGGIVTNPNCTSTGMTVALKAIQDAFGLRKVFAVSLQAISGAGYPGVPSLDILNNVIPYISGEEDKVEIESRKMLGLYKNGGITLADFKVSAHTNRVPVNEGHTVCMSVELEQSPADSGEVSRALAAYVAPLASRELHSTPQPVIQVRDEADRPQPRLDVMIGAGMTTVVGRIRPDNLLDYKMVVLSHNTIRGAAGGSIYNAELLIEQNVLAC